MDQFGLYPNGTKVTEKPEILFARMDIKEVMEKVEAMRAAEAEKENAGKPEKEKEESGMDVEKKPEITYDDFAKLQFQIGEVVKCEEVPKSKNFSASRLRSAPRQDRSSAESRHGTSRRRWSERN